MPNDINRDNPYSEANTYPAKDNSGPDLFNERPAPTAPGMINRSDPYAQPTPQLNVPPSPTYTPQTGPVGPQITQQDVTKLLTSGATLASPLNSQAFAQAEINNLEANKGLKTKDAEILAAGELEKAAINEKAAKEDQARQEQLRINMAKAVLDADARDEQLRKHIQEQYAAKIDPEHWWESKSTGGKVLAGIGMILGGLGGALQKTGRNPALELMNRAIDNDIASQKSNIEKNFKAIADQHGLDNDAFNRELHKQTWENNFRTAALENVKLELASAASKTQSELVKNNAAMGIQALTHEQLKIRNDMYKLGVSALAADQARQRKLSEQFSEYVMKLDEKPGSDHDTNVRAARDLPQFRSVPMTVGEGEAAGERTQQIAAAKAEAKRIFDAQLLGGSSTVPNMSGGPAAPKTLQEIENEVVRNNFPQLLGGRKPIGTLVTKEKTGQETEEQLKNRTVIVDGKPMQAVNSQAAKDYKEYQDSSDDVQKAFATLKDAWDKGDVGRYEAARGQLIDSMPKFMLGSSASGPTIAQAKETYGQLIPDYRHWYTSSGFQHRTDEAFGVAEQMINSRRETINNSTFVGSNQKSGNSATTIDFKEKK